MQTTTLVSNVLLAGLIAGMAGTVELQTFRNRMTNTKAVGMGLVSQFGLLPLLGFVCAKVLKLDPVAAVALIITTTCPGGGFSGLFCSLCNADLALSVAMTTASSLVCAAFMPLNVALYAGSFVPVPKFELLVSSLIVLMAVVFGLTLSQRRPGWRRNLNKFGSACGIINIFVAMASSGGSDKPFWDHSPSFLVSIGAPCLAGLVIAFGVSRLLHISPPQAVAISIECCYQNTALALSICTSVFQGKQAAYAVSIPLIYGMAEPLFIAPFCVWAWKMGFTYCHPKATIERWLLGNWQPQVTQAML